MSPGRPSPRRRPVLLVTGGSRGIGAATARLAATRGYDLVLNYTSRPDAAEAVGRDAGASGGRVRIVQADVGIEGDVQRMFAEADATFGGVDALVNNAGILDRQMRLDEMSVARWQRIFTTNVLGAMLCAREAVRRMSSRHGGHGGAIVNVSSVAARTGSPGEYVDYAASKGALDTFTIGLAREVALEGIRVNGVRPAFVYTDIHASGGEADRVDRVKTRLPMQRGGHADEVARAILWLLSDESSFTTGSFVDVTGGL